MRKPNTETDVWRFIDRREDDDCWPWTGARDRDGYGVFKLRMVQHRAHRIVCAEVHGAPPAGRDKAIHSCDNPSCCNPRHLRWATIADNNRERDERGRVASGNRNAARLYPDRWRRGEGHGNARLTDAQVREIRAAAAGGAALIDLARMNGVSDATIARVVKRTAWKHVA